MEINIRELEERDYPALLPLWREFGGYASEDNVEPHYERMKNDGRYKTYVASGADGAVGFITSVTYYGIGVEGPYMIIIGISVREDARGTGIGTKLIKRMEEHAKEIGVFSVYLNSDFKRTAAHAFYERNGYGKGSYGFGKIINPVK